MDDDLGLIDEDERVGQLEAAFKASAEHNGTNEDDPAYFRKYVWVMFAAMSRQNETFANTVSAALAARSVGL